MLAARLVRRAPSAPMLLEEKLRGFGYGDASEELAGRILALVSGRRSAVLSEEARTRLRLLVQFVVGASAAMGARVQGLVSLVRLKS